jgi:hypothetical protein
MAKALWLSDNRLQARARVGEYEKPKTGRTWVYHEFPPEYGVTIEIETPDDCLPEKWRDAKGISISLAVRRRRR